MKVYTVQRKDKFYYDFSTELKNCGCYTDRDKAIARAKQIYEKMQGEYEDEMIQYSDKDEYEDEDYGALVVEEDVENGYYEITFGFEEDHEVHSVAVDEWELELDEFKFYLQKKNEYFLNDVKSKLEDMELTGLSDEDIKSIAYKAEKGLDWNDSYWESYWMSIEYAIEDYMAKQITTQD